MPEDIISADQSPREKCGSTGRESNGAAVASPAETWVFGYGSLVWRPSFPFSERVGARLFGWRRRFWQGSTDHRGVPGAPGRVVTLERAAKENCGGVAYRLPRESRAMTLEALDVREQGGYAVFELSCSLIDGRTVQAMVYVATPDNPNYLGPADRAALVRQIVASAGPSGPNAEYVLRLADSLEELEFVDLHVARLAQAVRAAQGEPLH